jgi:hypothetical protein
MQNFEIFIFVCFFNPKMNLCTTIFYFIDEIKEIEI